MDTLKKTNKQGLEHGYAHREGHVNTGRRQKMAIYD